MPRAQSCSDLFHLLRLRFLRAIFRSADTMGSAAPTEIVIDRVPAPSPEEFESRYVSGSQPVIFTDLVPTWRAWGLWSPEYFRQTWGDHQAQVMLTGERMVRY